MLTVVVHSAPATAISTFFQYEMATLSRNSSVLYSLRRIGNEQCLGHEQLTTFGDHEVGACGEGESPKQSDRGVDGEQRHKAAVQQNLEPLRLSHRGVDRG